MARGTPSGFCSQFQDAVELIGRRWNGAIIRLLFGRPHRFAELVAGIPDLSDRMLAERLRELESAEIVTRTVIPEIPVRVEYALTEKGRDLEGAIRALAHWAERWTEANDEPAKGEVRPRAAKARR